MTQTTTGTAFRVIEATREATAAATITKTPETGVSVLGMTTVFSLLPFGLFLARYGKGRKLVTEQINLASLGQTLVNLRSRGIKRI